VRVIIAFFLLPSPTCGGRQEGGKGSGVSDRNDTIFTLTPALSHQGRGSLQLFTSSSNTNSTSFSISCIAGFVEKAQCRLLRNAATFIISIPSYFFMPNPDKLEIRNSKH
jgi:hypothetical protein